MIIVCKECSDIILWDNFYTPNQYQRCLAYINELLETGKYELIRATCNLDKVKNEEGCFVDDSIYHVIKCKKCGQVFTCYCNTYHGNGSFYKGE